ncbi:MAG: 50S ribosomal protein L32 [Dehalococcoidia bacterium]|jgi:large subunit ribosomal protein L32|nr:50S ribosomal protein L32 [Dehalococcoidia bacterium]
MALPKRKYTKSRQGKRRSHIHFQPAELDECPQCHSPKRAHHVCPTCGNYGGREVIKVKGQRKKAAE